MPTSALPILPGKPPAWSTPGPSKPVHSSAPSTSPRVPSVQRILEHTSIPTSTLAVLFNYLLGRTSGSPACTQFGFSYPSRAPFAWRTQGLPGSHTASAPATLPGQPQHRAREFPQLAPTSASSVLLGGPLCRKAQDPLAYTQSSFCCSSRMLATWKTPEPPGSHSISASASLPENPLHREPQNIPCYIHFSFSSSAKMPSVHRAVGHCSLHPFQLQLFCQGTAPA